MHFFTTSLIIASTTLAAGTPTDAGLWAANATLGLTLALVVLLLTACVGAALLTGLLKRRRLDPQSRERQLRPVAPIVPILHASLASLGFALLAFSAWQGFNQPEGSPWPWVLLLIFLGVASGGGLTWLLVRRNHPLGAAVGIIHGSGAILAILLLAWLVIVSLADNPNTRPADQSPPDAPASSSSSAISAPAETVRA